MSRNNHEWFKFEFRAWLESRRVQRMSLAAQGLYVRALCLQATHGNIPGNAEDFAIEAKVRVSDLTGWESIQEHFATEVVDGDTYLYNNKLREHLNAVAEKKAKLAENGAKGGKTKSKAKEKAIAKPNAKAKASLRASSSNSYSISNSSSLSLKDFTTFWENYPKRRRGKKPDTMAAWDKAVDSPELAQRIIAHVIDRAAKDPDWLEKEGQFVPGPSVFLNNARWEDGYAGDGAADAPAEKPRPEALPVLDALDPAAWREVLHRLSVDNAAAVEEWILPLKPLGIDPVSGTTWILAPSNFTRSWVATNYSDALSSALHSSIKLVSPDQIGENL